MNDMYFALASSHPAWEVLKAHVARNLPEYITFIGALAIAAVCTMPKKMPFVNEDSKWQELWGWFRDSLQTAVPAARANNHAAVPPVTPPVNQPNPTPPEGPANPNP